MNYKQFPGSPYPLGATLKKNGVNFAIYAGNATAVDLCLYDSSSDTEFVLKLQERTHQVWHAFIPDLKAGQLYGYRVDGPYEPAAGKRFNRNKLLLDPYAKAISGVIEEHSSQLGYNPDDESKDLSFNETDSGKHVPKSVVIDSAFNWEGDVSPSIPYNETVIYEAHVKGLTQTHPEIPDDIRGTYAAISHPAIIRHLKDLGITAIELMPVNQFLNDGRLADSGLSNYWGYNTIGFFAPEAKYSSSGNIGEQVREFKQMVKDLHKAGIEVILDVVYNHTAEGNELGPTLCFKGIDNEAYYRLDTESPQHYVDYTGTGNTLNTRLPNVLRLIMDSLRYWITEMHVDGFRFDLAATLARELHEVDRLSGFFDIIYQDPIISQVKLIAEPWDIGDGGYQVGNFPPGWVEWNGKYRDSIRDFWRGEESMLAEFGQRFTGSPDLYSDDNRRPTASINFITAHDGFTLLDLVSYNEKHNEANGEDNNDGESHNRSWNCGAEGETDDENIIKLRGQQRRNFITTLFLSQGVPMIVAGDEIGKTQLGNNNAYCQDNEISWLAWDKVDSDFLKFCQKVIALRQTHPVFRRRKWFIGQAIHGSGVEDINWFLPDGSEMNDENWEHDFAKSLGVFFNGHGIRTLDPQGNKITDDSFYVIFNAHHDSLDYTLPEEKYGHIWKKELDTASGLLEFNESYQPKNIVQVAGRSVVVLKSSSKIK